MLPIGLQAVLTLRAQTCETCLTAISELLLPLLLFEKPLCLLLQKPGWEVGTGCRNGQGLLLNHCGSSCGVAVQVAEPVLILASWLHGEEPGLATGWRQKHGPAGPSAIDP